MTQIRDLDAVALSSAVRSRQISPVEIVESVLDAIETIDGELNSVVVVLADEARAAARRAEQAVRDGSSLGPLHGVPVTIKEPIWLAGAPATNGSLAYSDAIAPADALAVSRLRAAGAIVVGKTNVPEMQFRGICDNPIYGLTVNPWNKSRTAGGSSGGAAASVAAGITPLALGSDGGGSIRIPASFCGVAGLKPTRGVVPQGPNRPGVPSLTVLGPMARTSRDIGLMFDVLAGRADSAVTSARSVADLRFAFSVDLGFAPCSDEVRAGFLEQIDRLRSAGWNLKSEHPSAGDPTSIWYRIFETELYAANREAFERVPDLFDPMVREALEGAARVSASAYLDAQYERSVFQAAWSSFFDDVDVLLTPGSAITAFEAGAAEPDSVGGAGASQPPKVAFAAAMLPANVAGNPALTVPSFLSGGLPVGLQLIGPHGSEDVLLRVASIYEELRGPWPALPRQPTLTPN